MTARAAVANPRIRSMLYVPASSERFLSKAHERGADAVILDLEDSVAPEEKASARAALARWIPAVSQNGAKVFVRVNSGKQMIFADAEAACRAGAFGLFIPKTEDPNELKRLARRLDKVERATKRRQKTALVAMIESPDAVLNARALAAATPKMFGLVMGSDDLASAMGAEAKSEVLRFPWLMVHFAAKAAGIFSFGFLLSQGEYRDTAAIARAAQEARAFGFDGATCVHPTAVAILNEAFSPSGPEIDRAKRMVEAYEASLAAGKGACVFEGKMIDRAMVLRAQALLGVPAS
jgi:citrate lyase subunit beta/citryl-CoA lyase